MLKLLFCAPFFLLAVLLACSGPEATPAPTNTPEPVPAAATTAAPPPEPTAAPTQEPTDAPTPGPTEAPTPEPTAPPAPEPTAPPALEPTAPADEAPPPAPAASALTPLDVTDPEAFLASLSAAERACVTENIGMDQLMLSVVAPDLAPPADAAALVGCLEQETLLRLYLTPVLSSAGELSPESSACVRGNFAGVDLAPLMSASVAAGPGQDPEAAMVTMMAGFFATLSCLNEEEFQAAAPSLGMLPEDQAGLQCLMDALGGPEGFATVLAPEDEPPVELFMAAMACNLEMGGGPPS